MISSSLRITAVRRTAAAARASRHSRPPVASRFFLRQLATKPATAATEHDDATTKEEQRQQQQRQEAAHAGSKQQTPTADAPSLKDTIGRMWKDGSSSGSERKDESSSSNSDFARRAADLWQSFSTEVGATWQELIHAGTPKNINKKIQTPVETEEGKRPYTGPVDIMVIDPAENLTAWERMQKRLTEAPIIQDLLSRSEHLYESSGARAAQQRFDEIRQDAHEAWETSQNPWVYRASSIYDTLTAESPQTTALKELRVLDPAFTFEHWKHDVVEYTLPQIMRWFLRGEINQLKPWLGEGVFKRLAAEMKAREQEGVQIDTHVLGIMNSEILAVEPDEVNKGSPIIVLHFMVQQINCVKRKKDGEIVEGAEDDIRANSYVAAFQREYNEEAGELNWKIVDFRFNGAIAYL